MELWNEYEGRTIDGVFPLAKLLEPEGRSAFFSTPNGSGTPAVIRLIEAHFDDEEILARWRGVAALNHPNLVKLKTFGRVELDGSPLVYVVMEPAEANLGEIVAERRLTVEETRQIAASLVAALDALHSHGFVHEHVAPANVLAVGEEIKLRSDCIRETPEGDEGSALKKGDVHDLAVVLLQALTQKRTLEDAAGELPLAAPFDAIVRRGMSGDWGLTEISAALVPGAAAEVALPVVEAKRVAPVKESFSAAEVAALLPPAAASRVEGDGGRLEKESQSTGAVLGKKIALWFGVTLALLLAWFFLRGRPAERSGGAAPMSAPDGAGPPSAGVAPAPAEAAPAAPAPVATKPSATVSASHVAAKPSAAANAPRVAATKSEAATNVAPAAGSGEAGARVDWRVIVVTYNHEDQAQAKAARIAEKHPELHPDVFTPSGQAPYLVTIGGVMTRDEAFALVQKAREEGFSDQTYAQNYKKR